MHRRKPVTKVTSATAKRRGYDMGGPVISNDSIGKSIMGGFMAGIGMGKAVKDLDDDKKKPKDPNAPITGDQAGPGAPGSQLDMSYTRGGRIKHTSGPRIGKDDGLIPAQKGEYVIRKSAVNKLGSRVLSQVNKGKLPTRRGR